MSAGRRLGTLGAEIRRSYLSYLFIAPFLVCFLLFILLPIGVAIGMSFFQYNAISPPQFIGWKNFLDILARDRIFLQFAIPNTLKFAIVVGPGGYALSFFLAWVIHQLPGRIRDYFTLAIYAPSLVSGTALTIVWLVVFSGDRVGYMNNFLLQAGIVDEPVLWLQSPDYFMTIMIVISLWASMGVGFLAMLAGLQTVNKELYEAGKIDGVANRLQEVFYITIPSMKPQMLFGAVMAAVGTLKAGLIGSMLAASTAVGSTAHPITPQYSGHLIINHIDDYALVRYELGYAAALSVLLLLIIYGATKFSFRIFGTDGEG